MATQKNDPIHENYYQTGCFNLQFRKDVKNKRQNAPTYYRWKAQFIITGEQNQINQIEKIKNALGCGRLHFIQKKIRYSVQNINDLYEKVVPFFRKQEMPDTKKKDFELWTEAIVIIYKNKRKILSAWQKDDFQKLVDIQKSIQQYKQRTKNAKWINEAKSMVKLLN